MTSIVSLMVKEQLDPKTKEPKYPEPVMPFEDDPFHLKPIATAQLPVSPSAIAIMKSPAQSPAPLPVGRAGSSNAHAREAGGPAKKKRKA